MAIKIQTSRFGPIEAETDAVVRFPSGLAGFEDCRHWVLLRDGRSEAVAWLQSVERPEVALAVTSPRCFVPDYQVRVARRELAPLALEDVNSARVLVIVGNSEGVVTLNLKAPLMIHPARGLGRQVIVNGDLPVRHELNGPAAAAKRIA